MDESYRFRVDNTKITGIAAIRSNWWIGKICVRIEEMSYWETYDRGWFLMPEITWEDYYEEVEYFRP